MFFSFQNEIENLRFNSAVDVFGKASPPLHKLSMVQLVSCYREKSSREVIRIARRIIWEAAMIRLLLAAPIVKLPGDNHGTRISIQRVVSYSDRYFPRRFF